ncbi:dihydrofolate reductase family protein [Opitutus sp. GAS368]|uniref:dihydrofolate reductase family protein n=1 Tax=Opitutus sp. GAS368 TaxID=1882749 RepID=UPI0008794894|nr:dihydrofolate reductase family protein [Opitutus sp. GAS368]SDS30195.1 Dihydrofolate reductase [Opitutus sp. GAS368]
MTKLRVHCFTVSLDGFGAGPGQDLENPMGIGGGGLHPWLFGTRTANQMFGREGGAAGIDDDFVARGNENIGAWILGRNMFGPIRGTWPDDNWKGWWGDNPPYHVPVFVLTHHAREPIAMTGGTTFHFVTGGIEAALKLATAAAGGRDIRLGGGVATIQQYLRAGLVDEMHVAMSPVVLGSGESLFAGMDLVKLGYEVASCASSSSVTHYVLKKKA